MPTLTLTLDGRALPDIVLTRERTAFGRRPYNDIVVDHLAISGEHAVFVLDKGQVWVEDLHSTNGTFLNGQAITGRKPLGPDDLLEIGRYRFRLLDSANPAHSPQANPAPATPALPRLRFLSGPTSGQDRVLEQDATSLGKAGHTVVSIRRVGQGHLMAWTDGPEPPTLNGIPLGPDPVPLDDGDLLQVAGVRAQFVRS
jgi:pSer/pThr/pTyr-binding forkhead associated (FHA) protein